MTLEDLQLDASVRGILPDALVSVVSVRWHGSQALTLVYRTPDGEIPDEILYWSCPGLVDGLRLESKAVNRPPNRGNS